MFEVVFEVVALKSVPDQIISCDQNAKSSAGSQDLNALCLEKPADSTLNWGGGLEHQNNLLRSAQCGANNVAVEISNSAAWLLENCPELRDPKCQAFDYGNEFEVYLANPDGSLAHGLGDIISEINPLFHKELQRFVVEITTRPNAPEEEVRAHFIEAQNVAKSYAGARLSGGGVSPISPLELISENLTNSVRFQNLLPGLYQYAKKNPNNFSFSYVHPGGEEVSVHIRQYDNGEHYIQFPNLSYGPLSAYQEGLGTSWQISFQPATPLQYVANHRVVELTSFFRDAWGGSPLVFSRPTGVMIPRMFNWIGATHEHFTVRRSFNTEHFCEAPLAQTTHMDNLAEQLYLAQRLVIPPQAASTKDISLPAQVSGKRADEMRLALSFSKNLWFPAKTVISATNIYGGGLYDSKDKPDLLLPRIEARDRDTPYSINEFFIENEIFIGVQLGMTDLLSKHFDINGSSHDLNDQLPFRDVMRDRFAVAIAGIDALVSADMFLPGQKGVKDTVGNIWRKHLNDTVIDQAQKRSLESDKLSRLKEELELRSYLDRSVLVDADGKPYPEGTLGVSTGHLILDMYSRFLSQGVRGREQSLAMQRVFCDCFDASLENPNLTFAKYYLTTVLPQLSNMFKSWKLDDFVVDNPIGIIAR